MEMDRARVSRIAAKLRLVMPKTNSNEFRGWRRSVEAFRDTGIPGGLVELFDELSGYGEYARVGVGENISTDAALAIGEHAFRAGFEAAIAFVGTDGAEASDVVKELQRSWNEYDPPEDIKALS